MGKLQAWYELLPAGPQNKFSVSVGDEMYGYVYENSTNMWELLIEDVTSGYYYENQFAYTNNANTAEWITEVRNGGPVPTFHYVDFFNVEYYTPSGIEVVMTSAANLREYKLVAANGGCVSPSSVGSDHASFYNTSGC